MRNLTLFVYTTLIAFSLGVAQAQPIGPSRPTLEAPPIIDLSNLVTSTSSERLEIHRSGVGRSGPITGGLADDQIRGIRSSSQGANARMAFVRLQGNAPVQAFLAEQTNNQWIGTAHALRAANGGSAARNVQSFVLGPIATRQFCLRGRPCPGAPTPPPDPPPVVGPLSLAGDVFRWSSADTETGAVRLSIAANGDVSGIAFGDPVIGHHASNAGTLAFVRMRSGAPYQLFTARLSAAGAFTGEFYPIATQAGAFQRIWSALPNDTTIIGLQSQQSGKCAMTHTDAANLTLIIGTCTDASRRERWAFVQDGALNGNTAWRMVSLETGRCVAIAITNIAQQTCANVDRQRALMFGSYLNSSGQRAYVRIASSSDIGASPLVQIRLQDAICFGVPEDETIELVVAQDCPPIDFARQDEYRFFEEDWWGKRQ